MNSQNKNRGNKLVASIGNQVLSLFEELQLANQWQRPSILLASYRSKLVLLDAQLQLERKLRKIKQSVYRFEVNKENYDVPLFLSQYPERRETVFFISGLNNGGGSSDSNAYRALNIRRELFVDHQIRAVFWLNPVEADVLPLQALDFWSFRHRMIELPDKPTSSRIKAMLHSLNWPEWIASNISREIPNGISLREELLKEIPESKNAPAFRAELIHMLAALHWANREYNQAKKLLGSGLEITKKYSLTQLEARYYAALGLVNQGLGFPEQAISAFKASLNIDPTDATTWGDLGITYQEAQLPSEALAATIKSIELDPKKASAWKNLGNLFYASDQLKDAIHAYKISLDLDANDAKLWARLGDIYIKLNRPADALISLKKAKQRDINNPETYLKLGLVYRDLGLLNHAVRALYKTTRLDHQNSVPWKILGEIYRNDNRLLLARKAIKTARSLDPHDQTLEFALAACYIKKKKIRAS